MFDRFVARPASPWRRPDRGEGATASFELVTGREDDLVAQLARLADICIVPHPEGGDEVSSSNALHAVLFDSGRPVLIAAHEAPRTHRRARLRRLERHAGERGAGDRGAALAASGQKPSACSTPTTTSGAARRPPSWPNTSRSTASLPRSPSSAPSTDVGRGLLAAAAEFGADMLCMGAYSHSRLRQLILGGVTRHVLEKARIPVLMTR